MMRQMKRMAAVLALVSLTTPAMALNACGELSVAVVNNTKSDCYLESYSLLTGDLIDLNINGGLMPVGTHHAFYVNQNRMHGPAIQTTYVCGGSRVTFRGQQNYCFLEGGTIYPQIIISDSKISISETHQEGSYGANQPGQLNWLLRSV